MGLRVVVLGGTRFIGRRIVDELVAGGHSPLVVHRGQTEPAGLADAAHLHVDRRELASVSEELSAFRADAVLDCMGFSGADAETVLAALPAGVARLVVLSSMDTYRAYAGLHAGVASDEVPVDETSPVRGEDQRYPYRGQIANMDDYEKLDVESRWLARGGVALRLPMTYGEHDGQRREEFILRRVRAGRTRIPIGAGNALLTHGYVGDVARGVRLVLEAGDADVAGEVFNFGETRTPTVALRARNILEAAGASDRVELVRVPDDALPPDLGLTGAIQQHLLVDSAKARRVLGWQPDDPTDTLRCSVEWHLANAPDAEEAVAFAGDDAALQQAPPPNTPGHVAGGGRAE
jgi:UDP-glucose 4-epimerase